MQSKGDKVDTTAVHSPEQNHLLAAYPDGVRERIFLHLKLVELKLGDVIYESGQSVEYVYFPTSGIISMLYVLENGASAEIAVVGFDGMVGVAVFMGARARPTARLCKVLDSHTGCLQRS